MKPMRINVFGYEEEVFPLHISERADTDCFNLLLFTNENDHHYCFIRNFSRLIGDRIHHKHETYYCYRCLHRFCRVDWLNGHSQYCKNFQPQWIQMLHPEDSIMTFSKPHYQHPVPYIIYADFESHSNGISQFWKFLHE